jgi:ribosomal protein S18 acetylase RimI-like enzyme
MTNTEVDIRQLGIEDANIYRTLRLEALHCNPEAYSTVYEDELAQELGWLEAKTLRSSIFAAFRNGEAIGISALTSDSCRKKAHIGTLWAVYVRAEERRGGVGRSLLSAVIEFGLKHYDIIQLTVGDENIQGRRLYESPGFNQYGFEKYSMKDEQRYYDEVLMMKVLKTLK